MTVRRIVTHPLLWTAIVFAALPFVAGANPFTGQSGFVDIGTTMLIFALVASGFNLLLGHVGELSFGHAMFFAIGAYTTALTVKGFSVSVFGLNVNHDPNLNMWVALGLSLLFVFVWAVLLARLIVPRSSGVYYSMITLAFAQVIFFTAFTWSDLTKGEDGLQGVSRPVLPGLPAAYLADSSHFYVFTSLASFSSLAFRVGRTLKFIWALRAIIAGLIGSCADTMYYNGKHCVREEVVAMVILSYALCLSFGACIGFLCSGLCVAASDKAQHPIKR